MTVAGNGGNVRQHSPHSHAKVKNSLHFHLPTHKNFIYLNNMQKADLSERAVKGEGLQQITCSDCEFASRQVHGYLGCVLQAKTKSKMEDNQEK